MYFFLYALRRNWLLNTPHKYVFYLRSAQLLNWTSQNPHTIKTAPTASLLHKSQSLKVFPLTKKTSIRFENQPVKLFQLFVAVAVRPIKNSYKIHPSSKSFFLSYTRSGSAIFSVSRLYSRWQDFYHLLFNIFFYKLPLITFGTRLFQNELLALNFNLKKKLSTHWMLIKPYLFTKGNQINNYNSNIFSLLKLKGLNLALVIDTNYHQNTIFYLKRYTFFTIGVVPVTSNLYKVDYALPSNAESTYSHLFFIRLILAIRKNVSYQQFTLQRKFWLL